MVDGPKGWGEETGYGADEFGKPAFVVVASSPPESVRLTDLDWMFVTTGLPDAAPRTLVQRSVISTPTATAPDLRRRLTTS